MWIVWMCRRVVVIMIIFAALCLSSVLQQAPSLAISRSSLHNVRRTKYSTKIRKICRHDCNVFARSSRKQSTFIQPMMQNSCRRALRCPVKILEPHGRIFTIFPVRARTVDVAGVAMTATVLAGTLSDNQACSTLSASDSEPEILRAFPRQFRVDVLRLESLGVKVCAGT